METKEIKYKEFGPWFLSQADNIIDNYKQVTKVEIYNVMLNLKLIVEETLESNKK